MYKITNQFIPGQPEENKEESLENKIQFQQQMANYESPSPIEISSVKNKTFNEKLGEIKEKLKQSSMDVPTGVFFFTVLYTIQIMILVGNLFFVFDNRRALNICRHIFNSFFVYFVWFGVGKNVERVTGSTRYIIAFITNNLILGLILPFLLQWFNFSLFENFNFLDYYAMFEVILMALLNPNQITKIFSFEVKNGFKVVFITCFYYLIVNVPLNLFTIYVLMYTLFYYKFLRDLFVIGDQTVKSIENVFSCIINHFEDYVRFTEGPQNQNLTENEENKNQSAEGVNNFQTLSEENIQPAENQSNFSKIESIASNENMIEKYKENPKDTQEPEKLDA